MKSIDILGLFYGYKKMVSTCLDPVREKALVRSFRRYGLSFLTLDQNKVNKRENPTYLISRDPSCLREAVAAYGHNRFDVIGNLLGYPDCCCAAHYGMVSGRGADPAGFVRACTGRSSGFFWPLNNLLDFDGRLVGTRAPGRDISSLRYSALISHNPCSYDCRASLEIAARNYAGLARHVIKPGPEYDHSLLGKPALYVDDFNLAILDGRSVDGGIEYSGTSRVLGFTGLRRALRTGDHLAARGKELQVRRKGKIVFRRKLPKAPLLLPFDAGVPGGWNAAGMLKALMDSKGKLPGLTAGFAGKASGPGKRPGGKRPAEARP